MYKECPKCHLINIDDWPLAIDGEILGGGCQECWEAECDKSWWQRVEALQAISEVK